MILYFPLTDDYLHALPNRLFLPIAAGLPLIYPEALGEMRGARRGARARHRLRSAGPVLSGRGDRASSWRAGGPREQYRLNARRAAEVLTWERQEPRLLAIIEASLDGAGGSRA